MDINAAIGKVVRDARRSKGLTLFQLSRLTDFAIMQNAISELERGRTRWTVEHLITLAPHLDKSTEQLITEGRSTLGVLPKE